ncbi:MAG: class I SAM-dependent methyltransferase [Deltaproteobacteria bacterium]
MTAAENLIKSLIRRAGAITFARFMDIALYHPAHGYYTCAANIGRRGDYYTSPSVHRAFGETIANFIAEAAGVIRAENFSILEPGAGAGFLALDILDALRRTEPSIYGAEGFRYTVVESSRRSLEEAEGNLSGHRGKARFLSSLADLGDESICGVVLSNEFFDALAFHRLKFRAGKFAEILVGLCGEDFADMLAEPQEPELKQYLANLGSEFAEGQEIEANLRAGQWMQDFSRVLERGFILTIDYGFLAPELFHPSRMRGTFRCFHRHRLGENPYVNIGYQDITAHVNFSDLIKSGDSLGFRALKYTAQGQFLVDWGILDIMQRASEKERASIKNLFLPEAMGGKFKALLQERGAGVSRDFYPPSPVKIIFRPPGDRYRGSE